MLARQGTPFVVSNVVARPLNVPAAAPSGATSKPNAVVVPGTDFLVASSLYVAWTSASNAPAFVGTPRMNHSLLARSCSTFRPVGSVPATDFTVVAVSSATAISAFTPTRSAMFVAAALAGS